MISAIVLAYLLSPPIPLLPYCDDTDVRVANHIVWTMTPEYKELGSYDACQEVFDAWDEDPQGHIAPSLYDACVYILEAECEF